MSRAPRDNLFQLGPVIRHACNLKQLFFDHFRLSHEVSFSIARR